MDNEMIERVIKASFDSWKENRPDKSDYTVSDLSTDEYEFAVRHAKAIVKAMREPTDKMVDSGFNKPNDFQHGQITVFEIYQAMIDAVLND